MDDTQEPIPPAAKARITLTTPTGTLTFEAGISMQEAASVRRIISRMIDSPWVPTSGDRVTGAPVA